MRLVRFFKRIFNRTSWHTKPGHEIRLAFVGNDGTEYYEFVDGFSCYYERYMAIMDRLTEIECRVDKAFLDSFTMIMEEYLKKGDLYNASILLKNLNDRRDYVFNQELIYDLAAVWYFDKSENCYAYSAEYAEIKKNKWKKEKGRLSFFLQSDMKKYMPYLADYRMSLDDLEAAVNLETLTALRYHMSNMSVKDSEKEKNSKLLSQINQLEDLILSRSRD